MGSQRTILHILPGLSQGGTEAVALDVIKGLPGDRHVLVAYTDSPDFFELPQGAILYRTVKLHKSRLARRFLGLVTVAKGARIAQHEKPDVIIGWLMPSFLMAVVAQSACKAPLILSSHIDHWEDPDDNDRLHAEIRRYAKLSRFANVMHYCTLRGRLWHETFGFAEHHAVITGNGIDLSRFQPSAPPNNMTFSLLFPARFSYQKDHPNLFDAVRRLLERGRKITAVCVGAGTGTPEFAKSVADHGATGGIVGGGPCPDVERLYAQCDAVVIPSIFEAGPLLNIEALACGRPVIATDCGNCREVVADLGRIVPVRDPAALAVAIEHVMDDAHLRQRAFIEGPARVAAHYSIEKMRDGWRAMIDSAIANRTVRPATAVEGAWETAQFIGITLWFAVFKGKKGFVAASLSA